MHKALLSNTFQKAIKIEKGNFFIFGKKYNLDRLMVTLNDLSSSNQALIFDTQLREMLSDQGVISPGLTTIAFCVPGPKLKSFTDNVMALAAEKIESY